MMPHDLVDLVQREYSLSFLTIADVSPVEAVKIAAELVMHRWDYGFCLPHPMNLNIQF